MVSINNVGTTSPKSTDYNGGLSSNSDSLDDDILRSVDAFSDYDKADERLAVSMEEFGNLYRNDSLETGEH